MLILLMINIKLILYYNYNEYFIYNNYNINNNFINKYIIKKL